MCTLVTISRAVWDSNPTGWAARILTDAASNPHGVAALLAKADGDYTSIRTQDPDVLVGALVTSKWDRVWVHSRYGTGGANSLENTHGFCAGGVWYMHNGFIRQAPASSMPVDSMAIGKWISEGTVYDKLFRESYANVFLVAPHSGVYTVVRGGPSGQLHTDGQGNFSTVACGDVSQPVPAGTKLNFQCPRTVQAARWAPPSATTPRVTHTYTGGSQSRLNRTRLVGDELTEQNQARQLASDDSPRVFRNAREYWRAINAGEVEYDWETYQAIAGRLYHD